MCSLCANRWPDRLDTHLQGRLGLLESMLAGAQDDLDKRKELVQRGVNGLLGVSEGRLGFIQMIQHDVELGHGHVAAEH